MIPFELEETNYVVDGAATKSPLPPDNGGGALYGRIALALDVRCGDRNSRQPDMSFHALQNVSEEL